MIDYRRLGVIPPKPHTTFQVDGKMVAEHVLTREGFGDLYSILYQKRAPTHETQAEFFQNNNDAFPHAPEASSAEKTLLLRRHLQTPRLLAGGTHLQCRTTLFYNADCTVGALKPNQKDDVFFVNGDADELFFVAEGGGTIESMYGILPYKVNDYVFLPKGTAYRINPVGQQNMMVVEGMRNFGIPPEFRNAQGQLRLDAPYSHRDFRSPQSLLPFDDLDNIPFVVKRNNRLTKHQYTDFPYKVVGWDGFVYPFAFNVLDYQPKTSSVHLPPTIHLVFAAKGFVMMNFVPRVVDYAPNAIPCPYPHSSVDCDEILFYVKGNFTSRKSIAQYSMSYHPGGIPHGPHPTKYEESVGTRTTDELAIMVDTFEPLLLTPAAAQIEDKSYHYSWNAADCL